MGPFSVLMLSLFFPQQPQAHTLETCLLGCGIVCYSCLTTSLSLSSPRCGAPNGRLPSFSTHQVVCTTDMSNSVEMTLQGLRKPLEIMTFSFMRKSVSETVSQRAKQSQGLKHSAVTFKGESWRALEGSTKTELTAKTWNDGSGRTMFRLFTLFHHENVNYKITVFILLRSFSSPLLILVDVRALKGKRNLRCSFVVFSGYSSWNVLFKTLRLCCSADYVSLSLSVPISLFIALPWSTKTLHTFTDVLGKYNGTLLD